MEELIASFRKWEFSDAMIQELVSAKIKADADITAMKIKSDTDITAR
jgi:hypothetical protein